MTKTTIFGKTEQKGKKPIEFVKIFDGVESCENPTRPSNWKNITLLANNYGDTGMDLMYAYYDYDPNKGLLYLGHWNDGVV